MGANPRSRGRFGGERAAARFDWPHAFCERNRDHPGPREAAPAVPGARRARSPPAVQTPGRPLGTRGTRQWRPIAPRTAVGARLRGSRGRAGPGPHGAPPAATVGGAAGKQCGPRPASTGSRLPHPPARACEVLYRRPRGAAGRRWAWGRVTASSTGAARLSGWSGRAGARRGQGPRAGVYSAGRCARTPRPAGRVQGQEQGCCARAARCGRRRPARRSAAGRAVGRGARARGQ
jgi:hypothetical protein